MVRTQIRFWSVVSLCCLMSLSGCSLIPHLAYVVTGGPKVPAEFDGLTDRRVAVVCIANSSSYGTGAAAALVATAVEQNLRKVVKNIEIIPQDKIDDWRDTNDWDEFDFLEIGRGVEADMVVALELEDFRLRNGQTMYKGHADVTTSVYDITADGKLAFRKKLNEFTFPVNGGQHTTDTTERKFRSIFIRILAEQIARYFYDYEIRESFAQDAELINS